MKNFIKFIICSTMISTMMICNIFAAIHITSYKSNQGSWNEQKQFIVNKEPVKGWVTIDSIPYYFEDDGVMSQKEGKSFKIYQDADVRATLCNNKLLVRSREFAEYIDRMVNFQIELRKAMKKGVN